MLPCISWVAVFASLLTMSRWDAISACAAMIFSDVGSGTLLFTAAYSSSVGVSSMAVCSVPRRLLWISGVALMMSALEMGRQMRGPVCSIGCVSSLHFRGR